MAIASLRRCCLAHVHECGGGPCLPADTAAGKPGGGRGAAAPPNPEDEADEKLREFNKKFYDEFRKVRHVPWAATLRLSCGGWSGRGEDPLAGWLSWCFGGRIQAAKSGAFKQGQSSTARGDAATAEGSGFQGEGRPQAPPRPKGLRSTGKSAIQSWSCLDVRAHISSRSRDGADVMTVVIAGCCRSDGDDGDAGVERLQRAGHHRLRAPGRSTRARCQHRAGRALKGRSQELRSATIGLHDCLSAGLQWRERGQSENQWQTAQQLLLGTTCLKKNLRAGVCYEFRSDSGTARQSCPT